MSAARSRPGSPGAAGPLAAQRSPVTLPPPPAPPAGRPRASTAALQPPPTASGSCWRLGQAVRAAAGADGGGTSSRRGGWQRIKPPRGPSTHHGAGSGPHVEKRERCPEAEAAASGDHREEACREGERLARRWSCSALCRAGGRWRGGPGRGCGERRCGLWGVRGCGVAGAEGPGECLGCGTWEGGTGSDAVLPPARPTARPRPRPCRREQAPVSSVRGSSGRSRSPGGPTEAAELFPGGNTAAAFKSAAKKKGNRKGGVGRPHPSSLRVSPAAPLPPRCPPEPPERAAGAGAG